MKTDFLSINAEIQRINEFTKLITDLTVSKYGTVCNDNDIVIKSGKLQEIKSRLYDLKMIYERIPFDLPFRVREE